MNCKPGDLAYVVRDKEFPENVGRIVEVIQPAMLDGSEAPGFWWDVRALGKPHPVSYHGEACFAMYAMDFEMPDSDLRPISGVPLHDEACDEVTA